MSEFVGATPDELKALAHEFRVVADKFDIEGAGVLGFLRTMAWVGPRPSPFGVRWAGARAGITFGFFGSMLRTYNAPGSAAARCAGYLHGWVTSGLLAGVSKG